MDKNELSEPKYSNADVLRVTGIKMGTFQMWLNRYMVKLSDRNPGKGQQRTYSAEDVLRLAIIAKLVNCGFPPSTAATMLDAATDRLRVSTLSNVAEARWIFAGTDANGKHVVSWDRRDKIEDIWSPRPWYSQGFGAYVVVNVGEIKAAMFAALGVE